MVSRIDSIQRLAPCRCLDTLKNPTKCLWRWEPDHRSSFSLSPSAYLCAVTYITEISLHVTSSIQSHLTHATRNLCVCVCVCACVNWLLNVTINDISVIHVTTHRCAGGLKNMDVRSGSNVPVQSSTQGNPFYGNFEKPPNFPVNYWTGTLKNPTKCLWRWKPDRRPNYFFFSPPAHLCAVTCMTEISLTVTLNNQFTHSIRAWSF